MLITKTTIVCNKCGKEFVKANSNVLILEEEFFLCDKCLDSLLEWIDHAPTKEAPAASKASNSRFSTVNTKWDDTMIMKLYTLHNDHGSLKKCADLLKVSYASVTNVVHRIRNAKPGSDLFQYKPLFPEI